VQAGEAIHAVGHGFPTIIFPRLWAYEVCIFVRLKVAIASDTSLTINCHPEAIANQIRYFTTLRRSLRIAHLVANERVVGLARQQKFRRGHGGTALRCHWYSHPTSETGAVGFSCMTGDRPADFPCVGE
jgi:hypothetical protein